MGVRRLEDLAAYGLARQFKLEVYRLVRESPLARADGRYRSQLFEAEAGNEMNVAEGFRRFGAGDFVRFLTYARASLEEASRRLQDGIDREYFDASQCAAAFKLAEQSGAATTGLRGSLEPYTSRLARSPRTSRADKPPRRS